MNILVDAHVFDGIHQGTRTYIKGLYGELIKNLPGTSFFFAANDIDNLRLEIGEHANVHFIKLRHGKYLRLLLEIPMLIWKNKIDYAHFQYISPPIKNCRHIVTTHDLLFYDFRKYFPLKYRVVKDLLFRVSAQRADILLTVSEYSRRSISRHYRISMDRISITINGVGEVFFENDLNEKYAEIRAKYNIEKYLLYVSRVEPRKNHLILLKAFDALKLWERKYKLIFIGKKDFSHHVLQEFTNQCCREFKESVLYLENVNTQDLRTFYKHADLFIYPSFAEGFGIPPLEAISVGTSTLCSNATAMSEFTFLDDDLFDPNNIEELKAKILKRLEQHHDPDKVRRLQAITKERYSWAKSANVFISCLNRSDVKTSK